MSISNESPINPLVRPRAEEEITGDERPPKRLKGDSLGGEQPPERAIDSTMIIESHSDGKLPSSTIKYNLENLLPPSRSLMGLPPAPELPPDGFMHRTCEVDVGISQYIGNGISQINGIIKQRFTDFMVYEIDMTYNVAHVKSIERPTATLDLPPNPTIPAVEDPEDPWPASFDERLKSVMSEETITGIKELYLSGPVQPQEDKEQDAGGTSNNVSAENVDALPAAFGSVKEKKRNAKKGRENTKGRGSAKLPEDTRKVVSEPISLKESRYTFHQAVRELFGGKLETFTEDAKATEEGGSRIVVKWAGSGRNKGTRRSAADRDHQSYIHFTLQKTNRDTSDVLTHLARLLKTEGKNLSVAGTKDKRGVTCQRVCFRRGKMTVEEVWDKVNGVGRRSTEQIMKERGERGIRISDIVYRKGHLQLGMLKGNEFLITLRNVKAPSLEVIDRSMTVLKTKGFINYYGMQRFGTASIPTHAIGLALLRSDWAKAVDLILRPRPGESPDVSEARRVWAEEKNAEKALSLMPRRVVAERCILESFQKVGSTRNLVGALSTIPRNLRMMYIHAYQSYVWNAIVSERIKRYGHEAPVLGDIVYDDEKSGDEDEAEQPMEQSIRGRGHKSRSQGQKRPPRKVKVLGADDLSRYSIYDVLMPLPGTDVAYPGGELGELYRSFLQLDGLDPSDFSRKQREYSLAGSYRKIIHLPKYVSWETMRYTDPEIPLAQSDEDRILGIEPPQTEDNGLFLALQIRLQLGTACYATMALREVTKVDTSSHVQTSLTMSSEDQSYKGVGRTGSEPPVEEGLVEDAVETESIDMVAA